MQREDLKCFFKMFEGATTITSIIKSSDRTAHLACEIFLKLLNKI